MSVLLTPTGRVHLHRELRLPLRPAQVWGQLRDFARYACHDYFHASVHPTTGTDLAPGTPLTLHHRFAFIHIRRHGKLLYWRESAPQGYAFSDLSLKGPRAGFPHTFAYKVTEAPDGTALLHIDIRGLWTTPLLPHPLAKLWLTWVFHKVTTGIEKDLLTFALALQTRPK